MSKKGNYDRLQTPGLFPNLKGYVSAYAKTREKVNKYTNLDDKVSLEPSWETGMDRQDPLTITPFTAYSKREDEEDIELIRYLNKEYPDLFKHDYKDILPFLKAREQESESLRFQEFVVNNLGSEQGTYGREKILKMFPEIEGQRLDTIDQMGVLLEKLSHLIIFGYDDDEDLELLMQINEGNLTWHNDALKVCLGVHPDQVEAANSGGDHGTIPMSGGDEEILQGILSGALPLDMSNLFKIEGDHMRLNVDTRNPRSVKSSAVDHVESLF